MAKERGETLILADDDGDWTVTPDDGDWTVTPEGDVTEVED